MNAIPVNAENPTVEERSAEITLGGQQYELVLTTLATKLIARRYGGLENLGEKLSNTEHLEMRSMRSSTSSRCWRISP